MANTVSAPCLLSISLYNVTELVFNPSRALSTTEPPVGYGMQTTPREDLNRAFGKGKSTDDIILEILNKDKIWADEKEGAAQTERVHNELVSVVASKLVESITHRSVINANQLGKAILVV
ncbi:hypothetical protein ACHAPI_010047 [Fusarium lateritium]